MPKTKPSVYTAQFWLLCLSSFLFFASFNMLVPELPNYLTLLGGEEHKGLIVGLFSITACLSRPFSGKLADTWGRLPVMYLGVAVCVLCGLLYPVFATVAGFLMLRLLHGFSTGFTPTGNSAYIADVVPLERRGEAIGIFGLTGSLGMAVGPALGGEMGKFLSINYLFIGSAVLATLSIVVLSGMKETLPNPQKFNLRMLKIGRHEIFEPNVMPPFIVMLLNIFCFGAVLTLTPDFSEHLEMGNKGLFFTFFTLSSLGIRFLAGRASDKYGRVGVLKLSSLVLVISMITLATATTKFQFLAAAVLFGVGSGMSSPTLYAWCIDLSNPQNRGRAMATIYIALETGIGLGAFVSGWLYSNDAATLPYPFFAAAFLCFLAFLYLVFGKHEKYKSLETVS